MNISGTSGNNTENLCQLCNENPRKYTCPRCGIGYCTADCYKSEKHLECSESFYRQCVEEELKSQEGDPESRRSMIQILNRLREEELRDNPFEMEEMIKEDDEEDESDTALDSDDDENELDLEQRLENIDLDNADEIWSALTVAERQEFEALIKNGEVEKILPQWVPWWTYCAKKKLVEEVTTVQVVDDYIKNCPELIDVPIFSDLQKASPSIFFNLTNVVYAYAYMALYYNGDYLNCSEEAGIVFLEVCDNMRKNKVYEKSESAINSVIESVVNCNWLPKDEQTILAVREAGKSIMQGPGENESAFYISAALSELHRVLTRAKEDISSANVSGKDREFSTKFMRRNNMEFPKLSKKSLMLHCKKIEYYLSWIKSYGTSIPR